MFENAFSNTLNGIFGKIAPGMCKLTMSGGIAVKTSAGYRSYDPKKKSMTNCSNFVFNVGDDFFFGFPTTKVAPGDIILANKNSDATNGRPAYVLSVDKDQGTITIIDYETSSIQKILPERHVFMGSTYFYTKVVSLFGNFSGGKKSSMKNLLKFSLMSQMFGNSSNGTGNILPFMLLSKEDNMFEDMFNVNFDLFGTGENDETETKENEDEEEEEEE